MTYLLLLTSKYTLIWRRVNRKCLQLHGRPKGTRRNRKEVLCAGVSAIQPLDLLCSTSLHTREKSQKQHSCPCASKRTSFVLMHGLVSLALDAHSAGQRWEKDSDCRAQAGQWTGGQWL